MDKLSYGSHSIDFDALPESSRFALASRGLTHVLGNEIASKVHSWAMAEGQANSEDKATVKAWKEANASAIEARVAELQAETIAKLLDGTIGVRASSGPRLTPLDTLRRSIARDQVKVILRGQNIAIPKKDEKIKLANGEFTLDELVERRLVMVTKDGRDIGAEITREAEKELAARAKKAAKLAEGAESEEL